jgi:hypothetical protein
MMRKQTFLDELFEAFFFGESYLEYPNELNIWAGEGKLPIVLGQDKRNLLQRKEMTRHIEM